MSARRRDRESSRLTRRKMLKLGAGAAGVLAAPPPLSAAWLLIAAGNVANVTPAGSHAAPSPARRRVSAAPPAWL